MHRGIVTGGQGVIPPTSIAEGPVVSVSKTWDIAFYGCPEIRLTRNLTILPCILQFLNNLWRPFIFSKYIEIDHFKLNLLKRYDT